MGCCFVKWHVFSADPQSILVSVNYKILFYLAKECRQKGTHSRVGVNVTQPRQLLDLAESYTETFLTGSAEPESIDSESTDSESTDSESDPEWEVRDIIDGKVENGESHFLVDWKPTWMAESELDGARELIEIFREQHRHMT
jgi:hypothetical protein